jgi:hypothetical protein
MKTAIGALLIALVAAGPALAQTRTVPKDKGKTEKPADKPEEKPKDSGKKGKDDVPRLPPSAIPGAKNEPGGGAANDGGQGKSGNRGNDHCKGSPDCSKRFDGGK